MFLEGGRALRPRYLSMLSILKNPTDPPLSHAHILTLALTPTPMLILTLTLAHILVV